jgi:hypothetical protein
LSLCYKISFNFIFLSFFLFFLDGTDAFVVAATKKYEDCEKPPDVENASVVVKYDENEEFVTATYQCFDGYKLHGKSSITCDLDVDEWENPPTCEKRKLNLNNFFHYCSL